MPSTLALFGGTPAVQSDSQPRALFSEELYADLKELLCERPISTLFGEHDVAMLERDFAEFCDVPYAVALNSGTSSLHAALVALGVGEGDEVAVTAFSFIASATVILQVNATPVFVDIKPDTLTLDPEDLKRKITPKTKAVICVHIFGTPCDMDALTSICAENGLLLIEDACQALGATVSGRPVGSLGDVGCFSFNVNKLIQCGEGGILVTKDQGVAETVKELRVNGLSPFGYQRLGFNYTMTNIQALIARHQIPRIEEFSQIRKKHAELLSSSLGEWSGRDRCEQKGAVRVDYAVPVILPRGMAPLRETIIEALIREGVSVSGLYTVMYQHPFLSRWAPARGCATAEDIISRLVSINPSHRLSKDQMTRIASGVRKVSENVDSLWEYYNQGTSAANLF